MTDNSEMDISDVQNPESDAPPPTKMTGDISLDDALSRQAKKPSKFKKLTKQQKIWGAAGTAALILLLLIFGCQPKNGPMTFGVCSTFLELNTPYPHTLNYTNVERSQTAVRIYFTNVDPFGEFKQEMIECTFSADAQGNVKLSQVSRNRRAVDPAIVDKFNIVLPTIRASDPYRVLPPNWKNQLLEK